MPAFKGTEMHTNPAIVGALSALVGAIIGAAASLAAAIYTQRYQNRLQRVVRETSKRETVYADFIMSASSLLLKAYVTEGFKLNGEEQHLIGLLNRMRLFAPPTIIDTADAVIRRIIEISLQPSLDLRKLTMADLSKNRDSDLLLPFAGARLPGVLLKPFRSRPAHIMLLWPIAVRQVPHGHVRGSA